MQFEPNIMKRLIFFRLEFVIFTIIIFKLLTIPLGFIDSSLALLKRKEIRTIFCAW